LAPDVFPNKGSLPFNPVFVVDNLLYFDNKKISIKPDKLTFLWGCVNIWAVGSGIPNHCQLQVIHLFLKSMSHYVYS
jgi:hypothetical protein